MTSPSDHEYVLPTKFARRRLLAGRLVLTVICSNFALALIGAWTLTGPMQGLSRFRLGFAGWAIALFIASIVFSVPLVGAFVAKLLRAPTED